MFVGGLLIGGISVVDRRSDRLETGLSFIGQAFVGPIAFVVDGIHQSHFKGQDPATLRRREALRGERIQNGVIVAAPGAEPPMQRSLGKVNEIGVLYCLIAGMVNFIACLDALFPTLRTRRDAAPVGAGAIDAVLARSGGAS